MYFYIYEQKSFLFWYLLNFNASISVCIFSLLSINYTCHVNYFVEEDV